ncbi:MAG: GNAT family N-acetyltransferase [Bacteroidales bacterium]|nr:GNAT family N-acetyltransferase [Bacteroidales bacterium]
MMLKSFKPIYSHNTIDEESLCNYLYNSDELFTPRLSDLVEIIEYSKKLFKYADFFEAKVKGNIIGLLVIYLNNAEGRKGYISTLCISKEYQRKGIAKDLINKAIEYSKRISFNEIQLEVYASNNNAIEFYKYIGFEKIKDLHNSQIMSLYLNNTKE